MDPTTFRNFMASKVELGTQWTYGTGANSLANTFAAQGAPAGIAFAGVWTGQNYVVGGGPSLGPTTTNGLLAISPDGVNWSTPPTATTALQPRGKHSIATDGNGVVVVGQGTTSFIRSNDHGVTWSNVAVAPLNSYVLYWDGTQFCSPGNNGSLLTSSNGINWTTTTSATPNGPNTNSMVKEGSNYLFGAQQSGQQARVFRGQTVVGTTTGFSSGYVGGMASDGMGTVVAVGQGTAPVVGLSLYSTDYGTTWTQNSTYPLSKPSGSINGEPLIYDGSQFFVVCRGGGAMRSSDGITWIDETSLSNTAWGTTTVGYTSIYNYTNGSYLVLGGIVGTGARTATSP